jgi:transposase-like protein
MTTKRTWTDEEFIRAVEDNITIADVIRQLGLIVGGANYKQTHRHIERLDLSTTHWKGRGHGKCNHLLSSPKARTFDEILIENSTYSNTSNLKKRLLGAGLLENKCTICDMEPEWNRKELVMVLDHENGNNRDNRQNNLRLLCPNCNSQQPTFCRAKTNRFTRHCPDCGKKVSSQSRSGYCKDCIKHHQKPGNQYTVNKGKCKQCSNPLTNGQKKYCSYSCSSLAQRKAERPSKEQLAVDISENNWCAIGRKYGISDNAVRKWARYYQLI